jgi:hypothetical protein
MQSEVDHLLPGQPTTNGIKLPTCPFYLEPDQRDVPRSLICHERRLYHASILAPSSFLPWKSFAISLFAFLHPSEQFPPTASGNPRLFCRWRSNAIVKFRVLTLAPFQIVHHCNLFVFLPQLHQYASRVSFTAPVFQV